MLFLMPFYIYSLEGESDSENADMISLRYEPVRIKKTVRPELPDLRREEQQGLSLIPFCSHTISDSHRQK